MSGGASGSPGGVLDRLAPGERLVVAGAGAIALSMLFPWYGTFLRSLSATGFESLNFAHVALLVTAGAAVWIALSGQRARPLPRPLEPGALLIAAGGWCIALLAYLMLERPDFSAAQSPLLGARLRYGIFVALAGAVAIAAGGLRIRRTDPVRE